MAENILWGDEVMAENVDSPRIGVRQAWATKYGAAGELLATMGYTYVEEKAEWLPPPYLSANIPDDPKAQHLYKLEEIAMEDVTGLIKGDPKYGYSWKSRGGVGAYMMATRKADRLDVSMAPNKDQPHRANLGVWRDKDIPVWDIFAALEKDDRSEGVIDDIRDLRRYLLLIEAEARARGILHGAHRDNAQHP
jgi:hypothetical protein